MGCFDDIFDAILALEDNWNHNGATRFSKTLVERCRNLTNKISQKITINPTANNSIQFEFENENNEYLEIEIFENNTVEVFEKYLNGKESTFKILNITDEKILELISKFFKSQRFI